MATSSTIALVFKVRRCQPELVAPSKTTPHEFKQLSDIDDQESLRFQIPVIQFYRHNLSMDGIDPVNVIKKALAEALVFYYPFAGRLREGPGRKLFVECTGEGVLFIEADADLTLEQLEDDLQTTFSYLEELLYNVPNSDGILNCPLLLIQVTRLMCGGFIFALRLNHTMSDASGLAQFMMALAEMARGAPVPSVLPVWKRALLNARDPPVVTCRHREYDEVIDTKNTSIPLKDMAHRSVFFGPVEISTLRKTLPTHLRHCSTFEVITACLWRTRTIALQPDSEEEIRLLCLVNLRSKFNPLPSGYYGNAFAFPAAVTTASKLCHNSLGYAVELIRKAKAEMTKEYIKSVADLMVIKGRPLLTAVRSFIVSDVTRAGLEEVDFGWGKATYGGPTNRWGEEILGLISFYVPCKNRRGEKGILVPLYLPAPAMERFVAELDALLKMEQPIEVENHKPSFITSAL